MHRARLLCHVLVSVCIGTAAVFAGSTGKISGVVRDARTQEPVISANVVVQGTRLGASSNVEGTYVILNVPPGQQTVIASAVGYKRVEVRDVRVSVDFTTPLDIALEEGSVELEGVVVQAERTPLVRQDLTNPVASISSESIEALPITEISEVIGLQAGVTVGDDGSIHIRGGLGNEIAYTLNGMNINNPYGNQRSVGVATNAVQEVSVSSGTFNAEYGSALSGVVNYVTKDGGSRWSGSLKYMTGDHMSSRKALFPHINKINMANVNRVEASIGGPILGDDLSFFGSAVYNYSGGHLYGQRLYNVWDSYISRVAFPASDPRKGVVSDPYYFGPLLHDTTDLVGRPTGDGAIIPLNWSRGYNLQGNLSFRPASQMKLKYEFIHNFDESPSTSSYSGLFESRYKPDGRLLSRSKGYFQSVEFTHTVSSNLFYTLKGSYIVDTGTERAFEKIDDPRYLPSFYLQTLPNTGFLTGGVDPFRFYRKTRTWAGKFDLVTQLFSTHEVKFGMEFRKHQLDVESYSLQFRDPSNPQADPNFSSVLTGGSQFKPYIPSVEGGYTAYKRKPLQMAAYLQDKIELFRSIILNLGVRYEYFDPAARYNKDISSELSLQVDNFLDQNLRKAGKKHMVSPRFSVSYPITDQGTIRFSYGHFYQIGSLATLYRNPYFWAPSGTSSASFGNPNVRPQKSIQYELGLQQGLTEDLKVEITGYYKDVSDYIFTQQVITARGDLRYNVLTNLSYANTRGISISLLKRRAPDEIFSGSIDYTFQVAEGNRTEPSEEIFFNEQQGRLSETFLVPQSFDRSHTITSTLSLGKPNDWSVNLIGYLRAGTPYTPQFPANVIPITFVQNSDRQPLQWNVDLKAEKFFSFGPFQYSVFVQVDNLFDAENENYVYANSGRALYNIEETRMATTFSDVLARIRRGDPGMVPKGAIDNYYRDPANISAPRLVRFGASIIL